MRDLQRLCEPNGIPVPVRRRAVLETETPDTGYRLWKPIDVSTTKESSVKDGEQSSAFAVGDLGQFADFVNRFKESHQQALSNLEPSPVIAWLKKNGPQYAGLWIALDGQRLIAWGKDGRQVFEQASQKGCDNPTMVKVPPRDERPFGGW